MRQRQNKAVYLNSAAECDREALADTFTRFPSVQQSQRGQRTAGFREAGAADPEGLSELVVCLALARPALPRTAWRGQKCRGTRLRKDRQVVGFRAQWIKELTTHLSRVIDRDPPLNGDKACHPLALTDWRGLVIRLFLFVTGSNVFLGSPCAGRLDYVGGVMTCRKSSCDPFRTTMVGGCGGSFARRGFDQPIKRVNVPQGYVLPEVTLKDYIQNPLQRDT